jgi:hypothetical protein
VNDARKHMIELDPRMLKSREGLEEFVRAVLRR